MIYQNGGHYFLNKCKDSGVDGIAFDLPDVLIL